VIVEGAALQPGEWELLQGGRFLGNFGVLMVGSQNSADWEAEEGFDGVIELSSSAKDLFEAVRRLAEPYGTTERRGRKAKSASSGLSFREQEITSLVAKGYSNRRIAEMIGLQEQSVKNLVSSVMRRMGCENRTQLALQLSVTKPA
jgi:DNA-binding NarL/FixJ family response regulator